MKLQTLIVVAVALTGCIGGGSGTQVSSSNTLPSGAPISAAPEPVDSSFAGMLNGVRMENGAGAVTHDARLARAA